MSASRKLRRSDRPLGQCLLWAVPVQAGKVCNHRSSPNRHLSSIPRNGYGAANMQCAGRATAHREPLVDGKIDDQLMSASGKLQRGMRWPVKVRKGPTAAFDIKGEQRPVAASCIDVRNAGEAAARSTRQAPVCNRPRAPCAIT